MKMKFYKILMGCLFYGSIILFVPFLSHADIRVCNFTNERVLTWPTDAIGNIVPTTTIAGGSTSLDRCRGIAVDADWIYVANNNSITIYQKNDNGNIAPTRTIAGPQTGMDDHFTSGIAVDASWIYITMYNGNNIRIFPIDANGNVPPTRIISGSSTNLYYPAEIDVTATEIYVTNYNIGTSTSSITVFPINADGNVSPTRSIQGGNTLLSIPFGIAVDSSWIYVANHSANSITVFPIDADGNVAPTRSIQGGNTLLSGPAGLAVDSSWIYVANQSTDRITVFPIGAAGNITPSRTVAGVSTTLSDPWGIALDPLTYTIEYNANGADSGSVPAAQTKTQGVDLTLASNSGNLAKTGHTFAGWNTNAAGTGTDYAEGATYSTDAALTLYAKWTTPAVIPTMSEWGLIIMSALMLIIGLIMHRRREQGLMSLHP